VDNFYLALLIKAPIFVLQKKEMTNKTQSKRLSENRNQHVQKNVESQKQDLNISEVVKQVKFDIEKNYSVSVKQDTQISCIELENMVCHDIESRTDTYIKPDGGFLSIEVNGIKCYILVSEQKKQGTNDSRILERKSKQAKGNAVERLGKNVDAFDILFGNEDIYPFVCFLQGCDFYKEESTIVDRVRTIAKFQSINTINLFWKKISRHQYVGGSYFMRGHSMYDKPGTSDWTYQEMYDIMYRIASKSVEYYLSKPTN